MTDSYNYTAPEKIFIFIFLFLSSYSFCAFFKFKKKNLAADFWIWICFHTLHGPFLVIFSTEHESKMQLYFKSNICTIWYCTGFIKNRLKTFLPWLSMCGRQPLEALCLLTMKMQRQSLQ